MKNIVLIGFMGTGKSVVGKRLAAGLGWTFYDTDRVVESRTGLTVAELFEKQGEDSFRLLEREVVREVSEKENCVISTGGGAPVHPENVQNLSQKGELICLTASPEVIFKRVERRLGARPLLLGTDPLDRIKTLLEERRPFYAQASFTIDTTYFSIEKITDAILRRMRSLDA